MVASESQISDREIRLIEVVVAVVTAKQSENEPKKKKAKAIRKPEDILKIKTMFMGTGIAPAEISSTEKKLPKRNINDFFGKAEAKEEPEK